MPLHFVSKQTGLVETVRAVNPGIYHHKGIHLSLLMTQEVWALAQIKLLWRNLAADAIKM